MIDPADRLQRANINSIYAGAASGHYSSRGARRGVEG